MTQTFIVHEWLLKAYTEIGPCVVETSEVCSTHVAVRFPDKTFLIVEKRKLQSAIVMPIDESYA